MAINDIVQTIAEARVDARSLSEFVFKPAGFKVTRRLAPTVDTLQFYIDRFNSLNGDFSSSVSVALSSLNSSVAEADGKVAYIETTVQDAINNTAIEGGVLADTFVTVTANGVGTVARTQRDKNADVVSVKDFGAKGDGVSDDTLAIQQAIDYGQENGKSIYIPTGNYSTNKLYVLKDKKAIKMYGDGMDSSILTCRTATTAMIVLGSETEESYVRGCMFVDITLAGKNLAESGIVSEAAPYTQLFRCSGTGFTKHGLARLRNSWVSVIEDCRASYCSGDGLTLLSDANKVIIRGGYYVGNDGWGIVFLGRSSSPSIEGTAVEKNKKGGVVISQAYSSSIKDAYFESNAEIGDTFNPYTGSSAPVNVKTDVLVCALLESDGELKYLNGYPAESTTISSIYTRIIYSDMAHITVLSGNGVHVSSIHTNSTETPYLINDVYRAENSNITVDENTINGFGGRLIKGYEDMIGNAATAKFIHDIATYKAGRQVNYAPNLSSLTGFNHAEKLVLSDSNLFDMGRTAKEIALNVPLPADRLSLGYSSIKTSPLVVDMNGDFMYLFARVRVFGAAQCRLEVVVNSTEVVTTEYVTVTDGFVNLKPILTRISTDNNYSFRIAVANIIDIETDYVVISQFITAKVGVNAKDL